MWTFQGSNQVDADRATSVTLEASTATAPSAPRLLVQPVSFNDKATTSLSKTPRGRCFVNVRWVCITCDFEQSKVSSRQTFVDPQLPHSEVSDPHQHRLPNL